MKNKLSIIYLFLMNIIIAEFCLTTNQSKGFIPTINEPNKLELKSTSIQIGQTALQLIQFGQFNEAIKLLKLAVNLNPEEEALWISLAEAQMRSNKNKEAIFSLNKAINLNPKKQNTYFMKSSAYLNLNQPKQAKITIKKGLLINDDSERGYFHLGNAEIISKNYNSALSAFQKSSKLNSNYWQSINNEGLVLYELDNKKEAISKFRLALKISKDAEPMLALAIALFTYEDNDSESIKLAKNALESNPKYISKDYQAKQLWGEKLQKAAQLLFKTSQMKKAVEVAKEKSE